MHKPLHLKKQDGVWDLYMIEMKSSVGNKKWLEIKNYNKSIIETAIMSVLCKTKIISFEEIVRTIITEDELDNNKFLIEFENVKLAIVFRGKEVMVESF